MSTLLMTCCNPVAIISEVKAKLIKIALRVGRFVTGLHCKCRATKSPFGVYTFVFLRIARND